MQQDSLAYVLESCLKNFIRDHLTTSMPSEKHQPSLQKTNATSVEAQDTGKGISDPSNMDSATKKLRQNKKGERRERGKRRKIETGGLRMALPQLVLSSQAKVILLLVALQVM